MAIDLLAIEAALNAYPWTTGAFTEGSPRRGARYCALGLMLRYSGVAQDHLATAQQKGGRAVWRMFGALLQRDYGIPDYRTAELIMIANDSARTHDEAIGRVREVLTRGVEGLAPAVDELAAVIASFTSPSGSWDDGADEGAALVSA